MAPTSVANSAPNVLIAPKDHTTESRRVPGFESGSRHRISSGIRAVTGLGMSPCLGFAGDVMKPRRLARVIGGTHSNAGGAVDLGNAGEA
jgi:hypothetical protein